MLTQGFYKFYNELVKGNNSIHQLLDAYTSYMVNEYSAIHSGFCSTLDNGAYSIVSSYGFIPSLTCSFPLQTHDIHQDIYNLNLISIHDKDYYQAFTFLHISNYQELETQILNPSNPSAETILLLNLFHENYLIGNLVFLFDRTDFLTASTLETIHFIRNTLEKLILPLLGEAERRSNNNLLKTVESIIGTKYYLSADSSIFLARLLDLAFEMLDEPDYGSALLFDKGQWNFIHTHGHDLSQLIKLSLPENAFSKSVDHWQNSQEVAPNIYIIDQLLNKDNTLNTVGTEHIFDAIRKACMPIKQTIQLHIYFNGTIKGVISLDKKADSPHVFTRNSIQTLKHINLIGQILFTYCSLNTYTLGFENLTTLISKLMHSSSSTRSTFLHDFLILLVESIYEADYASAYIRDSDKIIFLEAIGHDINALRNIDFKSSYFIDGSLFDGLDSNNQLIRTAVCTNLFDEAKTRMPEDIYNDYITASKPIKDGLISQAVLDTGVFMNISIDIRSGSHLTFTKDSIHMFSVLNNLGFAFISNQYYLDKINKLNEDLETKIVARTKELEESNEKLQSLVDKDSLTGLFNHKFIIDQLANFVALNIPFSVFLFDIDYFKEVNDKYGHPFGDDVLVTISNYLMTLPNILSGRYGGEEFLLIIKDLDLPEAISLCQQLIYKISQLTFTKPCQITVSGGVVTYKKGTPTEIIHVADTLLYKAKSNGRNRIDYNYC